MRVVGVHLSDRVLGGPLTVDEHGSLKDLGVMGERDFDEVRGECAGAADQVPDLPEDDGGGHVLGGAGSAPELFDGEPCRHVVLSKRDLHDRFFAVVKDHPVGRGFRSRGDSARLGAVLPQAEQWKRGHTNQPARLSRGTAKSASSRIS